MLTCTGLSKAMSPDPAKNIDISDLGRYLLNPNSIEIKKKLIGGEIHYKQGALKTNTESVSTKSCRVLPSDGKKIPWYRRM